MLPLATHSCPFKFYDYEKSYNGYGLGDGFTGALLRLRPTDLCEGRYSLQP